VVASTVVTGALAFRFLQLLVFLGVLKITTYPYLLQEEGDEHWSSLLKAGF
jgi:hypothetical protein